MLECLKDTDVSIRRRAVALALALINESNARTLVKELLEFLSFSDPELKPSLTLELLVAAERFAPHRRWHVDTMLAVFINGANHVPLDACSGTLTPLSQVPHNAWSPVYIVPSSRSSLTLALRCDSVDHKQR